MKVVIKTFFKELLDLYIDRSEFFLELLLEHIYLTLIAISIILIVGVSLGILMTYKEWFANIVLALTGFLYTIPSIAMFGFLIAFVGIGNTSAIIAISIYGSLPLIRNTYVGIKEVDPSIIEAATGIGSTERQLLLRIKLPLALPVLTAGFRTTVVMTIALGAIASFIGAGGLGVAIWRGISTNYQTMTLAGSLLVALFAVTTDFILSLIEKGLKRHLFGKDVS